MQAISSSLSIKAQLVKDALHTLILPYQGYEQLALLAWNMYYFDFKSYLYDNAFTNDICIF